MRKRWEYCNFRSSSNKPVDELKDPIGESSGDEMYNSDTKTTYMRREFQEIIPYILVSKTLAVSDQTAVHALQF